MTKTNDTISRAAALNALNGCTEIFLNNLPPTIYKEDAIKAVKALPSAQPVEDIHREKEQAYYCGYEDGAKAARSAQPGWIPTSEKLPEMTDTYLVQVGINENGEGIHTEVRTADWNVVWQEWYVHTTRCFVGDIIKWMPIPWEGGQE